MLPERVDLLVVGAGTAGAATAARAASHGLRVLCVERGRLEDAGASWVNGVSRADFAEAGLAEPEGDELRGEASRFHLFAGRGPRGVVAEDHGVLEVDMRLLGARLRELARGSGATLVDGVRVLSVSAGEVQTSEGQMRADAVVDASGLRGARLLDQAPVPRADLCAAAQAVFSVADLGGARDFLAAHRADEDETICFTGVAGGYSILNVRVHGDEVSLLTGSIPADGHPSGKALLDGFVAETDWIGERRFGGHRAIPLGRPLERFSRGRVAAVGDAARQVFSAHGSGIGAGLIAGRMLADTLHETGDFEDYSVRWMRRYGGLFAAYDVFRRFSQTLTVADLERLMESGVFDAEAAAAGLAQRWPRPSLGRALEVPLQLPKAGRLGARLAATGARMGAVAALYAAYPRGSRGAWSAATRALA